MAEKRIHFYNDHTLQGYLLAGMVALELLLVGLLLTYLYLEINSLIEGHLYRLHNTHTASWPELLSLLGSAVAVFLVVNLAALYLAHLVWGRYVKHTIDLFSAGLDRLVALDFSEPLPSGPGHHRIIELLDTWYRKEQERNRQIARQQECLNSYSGKPLGTRERQDLQAIVAEYRRLLTDG
jgi:hypothetical protein